MPSIWQTLTSLFSRRPDDAHLEVDKSVVKGFRKRYARFRKLLDANAALADLMAEMETKLRGTSLFGSLYVRHNARRAVYLARRMAESLAGMNSGRHRGLLPAIDAIAARIDNLVGEEAECRDQCRNLTLSLDALDLTMVDWVGGKCANLGEMKTEVGVAVPRGFAITVTAFHSFMAHEDLGRRLEERLAKVNAENREELTEILNGVREMVEQSPLPPALEAALETALREAFGNEDVSLAVRSSAQSEDGDKSFAGQFLSVLNVPRSSLADSYRKVISSLFSPSATIYRLHQGIPLSASAMGVACIEMVRAEVSGVAYSHDPVNLMADVLVINAIWGLGRYLVDGIVQPDLWMYSREEKPALIRRRPGHQHRRLFIDASGWMSDQLVPEELQKAYCLKDEEALELARAVMRLEKHYGGYQDVEWAKDAAGKLIFLQSRPLDVRGGRGSAPKSPLLDKYPLLAEGGDIASAGVGCGPVVLARTPEDLLHFPKDAVLVALHSSAEYAAVMDRVQAVITETGGITGHMATICREFKVPALLNVPNAMKIFQPGQLVTVDAFSGRVYDGRAEELLPLRLALDPVRLQDTPVHALLRQVSKEILPLNLTDPAAANFTSSGCLTLHDVMRYAHEFSYHEMFAISDSAVNAGGVALKLKAPLPIDLHIIDLDNGAKAAPGARTVTPEEILSAPLKALLGGMLRPEVVFRKPRPINMGGFMSVMGQQMLNPQGGDGRFGDKSYAIISDRYMNFSSRVGYHYSVLDAYCGLTDSKNYISFSFQGGAAGETRRERRCRAIGLVLEELGFSVRVQSDLVKSRIQKYDREVIADLLDQLGRLLQVTRQMDMLMTSEAAVTRFKDDFMNSIYR